MRLNQESSKTDDDSSVVDEDKLLSAAWNQNHECFTAGTRNGFRVYCCDPFQESFRRNFKNGDFGIVEMLFRTNYFAVVGGGDNPKYPDNKVMVWDDHLGRFRGEISFRSSVRGVRLGQDRIVVALEHRIYVYNLIDLKHLHQIETLDNPRGLCCLSYRPDTYVLACLGIHVGQVRVEHLGLKVIKIISAHDSNIACFTLTEDGLILATASVKGTLIRIFSTMDGTRLQEVRRGVEKAEIYSIAFAKSLKHMIVSSDKGTIHIFILRVTADGEDGSIKTSNQDSESNRHVDAITSMKKAANPGSSLSFMKGVLPKYFSSEWSFAQFHLPEVSRYIAAFGSQNNVIVIGMDGSFYKCSFDPVNGGIMEQKGYTRFLKAESPVNTKNVQE